MGKVLFIAYFFPPSGESGMWRSLKFVKYLPKYGWKPVVLTIRKQGYYIERLDYTSLEEIPELTRIYRTIIFHPLSILNAIISVLKLNKNHIQRNPKESKNITYRNTSVCDSLKRHLLDFFTTPDRYSGWLPFAIIKGAEIILKDKPDIIFSTSPPITSHLVALFLKRMFCTPWVADFRDPWTFSPIIMNGVTKIKRFICILLEKAIVSEADKVIANTEPFRQQLIIKYGSSLSLDRFTTITNGYDSSDIRMFKRSSSSKGEIFVISHTGEFYYNIRTPDNFLIALAQLISENFIDKEKIRVNFVGGGHYTKTSRFKKLLLDLKLGKIVDVIDFIPHKQCIEYLYNSTILLLLQPRSGLNLQIPAKTFEYIGVGKPILAITPVNGATAQLITNTQTGVIVNMDDVESIKQAILRLFLEYKMGDLSKYLNKQARLIYSRKNLTKDLSELFNQIVY